ncbi:MAG: NAD-dependent epimerase/dehydratase, partial [uncultured bacterium]
DGSSSRDYTYIDDIVDGIVKSLSKNLNFEIINLGNNHPITLSDFIKTIEKITGKEAKVKNLPMQPGDVKKTWANIHKASNLLDWRPYINLQHGIQKTVKGFLRLQLK